MLTLPLFNEPKYSLHQMNHTAKVLRLEEQDAAAFDRYCAALEVQGFSKKEERDSAYSLYCAFQGKEECIFINYFKNTKELQIVAEENCRYFDFSAPAATPSAAPQITQLHLSDFGMSYILRLSDGRFILIDGGNRFEADADRLFEALSKNSPTKTPVIAAWIITHPHSDHYHCLFPFFERHGKKVKVERFLLNFCKADDFAHYPKLSSDDARLPHDTSEQTNIPLLDQLIEKSGAARFMPQTGQTYKIGDATLEFLSSLADTIHCSNNINAASLVFRMEFGGQVILWTADAAFSYARIPERYGKYLKSDILQVPHHGFGCGEMESQIQGFKLVAPKVCLLPVSDFHAYTAFSGYRDGTRFLMEEMGISEMITGDKTTSLPLPYTPVPNSAEALASKFLKGRQDNGARTWIFADLSTGNPADFEFTILNTTYLPQKISIDLFFEERAYNIEHLTAEIEAGTLHSLSLLDQNRLYIESEFFQNHPLDADKLPKNRPFAARISCKEPIVVFHKEHKETYHSIY